MPRRGATSATSAKAPKSTTSRSSSSCASKSKATVTKKTKAASTAASTKTTAATKKSKTANTAPPAKTTAATKKSKAASTAASAGTTAATKKSKTASTATSANTAAATKKSKAASTATSAKTTAATKKSKVATTAASAGTTAATKKSKAAANSEPSKPVTGKRGLKGQAPPDPANPGIVDPAANLSANAFVVADEDGGDQLDAMLNEIDVSKNIDKYYVLQVVCEPPNLAKRKKTSAKGKAKKTGTSNADQFYFFSRWGRTGTAGACKLEGPFESVDEASTLFEAKFREKTGIKWDVDDPEDRHVAKTGKYTCLRLNKTPKECELWQYWVDDGVDGKTDGWYDYDDSAAEVVEDLNREFEFNPHLFQRVVASGAWTYLVDLNQMTQTNVTHPARKCRHIRRNPGRSLLDTPPGNASVKKGKGSAGSGGAVTSTVNSSPHAEVDRHCPKAGSLNVHVCGDHDVMLNRTDIAANNNKFYLIQMCRDGGRGEWFVWCRWGRVGEIGANSELGPFKLEADASAAFAKKFKEKTRNKWEDARKGKFEAVAGQYELIETDNSDLTAAVSMVATGSSSCGGGGPPAPVLPCKLDTATKELVDLIFNEDMFKGAMSTMNLDVNKMPLGQLSKAQVQRGYAVLAELEDALKTSGGRNGPTKLATLSARFFQVIPHAFGRTRPPVIDTAEEVNSKVEMLNVLQDISEAQSMLLSTGSTAKGKGKKARAAAAPPAVPHPSDVNYDLLHADIKLVPPGSQEFKAVKCYLEKTKPTYGNIKMYDLWTVDRQGEAERFDIHKGITNRKLLWHGTNVAVVAAIVKSGLRIMPHSGGRVGKGIYFASENAKSFGYVRPAHDMKGPNTGLGIMFLCEVALGKEATITQDNSGLNTPPKGFDSVVARGSQEPDPSKDTVLTIDGFQVTVPQGKPISVPAYKTSSFFNSEYLVYKESQQRIRYMLTVKG